MNIPIKPLTDEELDTMFPPATYCTMCDCMCEWVNDSSKVCRRCYGE